MTNILLDVLVPSEITTYNALFAQIDGIRLLTIGAPNFDTPDFVKEAGKKAIDDGFNGYAPAAGLPVLRQAFVDYLKRRYDLDYRSDQVLTGYGLTQVLPSAIQALLNPGDEVLIPTPTFPQYEANVLLHAGKPLLIDTTDTGFRLTPQVLEETLKAHPKAKVLILNYPSNPTGVTYSSQALKDLAAIIEKYPDLIVISDEIYSELVYEDKHDSIARYLPQQTILLNGVSKSHAMTGWRIGFAVTKNDQLFKKLFLSHEDVCAVGSQFAQIAAAKALNDGDQAIADMKASYKERRDYLVKALAALGFDSIAPEGAFYLFPRIPESLQMNDKDFAVALAKEAKIGVVPGSVFGPGGQNHIRISYATSLPTLVDCVASLTDFMASHSR